MLQTAIPTIVYIHLNRKLNLLDKTFLKRALLPLCGLFIDPFMITVGLQISALPNGTLHNYFNVENNWTYDVI